MSDPTMDADDAKLRELVLYVSERSEADEFFGATKLNKILFFADFTAYVRRGRSITGHEYQRLPKGPAPRRLLPIRNAMVEARDLAIASREYRGYEQKRPVALREPNLEIFSGDEIAIVDHVLEKLRGLSASGVSTLSHRFIGWEAAAPNETIPYDAAFLEVPEESEFLRARAGELEARGEPRS